MPNRIRQLSVRDRLHDPTASEVWISVVPEQSTATLELRGRIMGPRCRYATTVEVAYPLRPFPRPIEGLPPLTRRVLIPEASMWDPASPFLYEGPVELWDGDQKCDERILRHGLRTLSLNSRGLRLNGKPFALQGVRRNQCSEDEALRLRQDGENTLLADVATASASLWDDADRLGFFVLGRISAAAEAIARALERRQHPCCLGWLLDAEIWNDPVLRQAAGPLLQRGAGELLGMEAHAAPAQIPEGVQFLAGPAPLLTALSERVPCLALMNGGKSDLPPNPTILGVIRS